jgi:hypothetical protein
MKHLLVVIVILGVCVSLGAVEKYSYVGVKKCLMCHKGANNHMVYEKWLESKHANAFKVLNTARGEDKKPECLACHTTGFGSGGYVVGDANAAQFEGVQCESCHGPGSAYKALSVMKDPKAAQANGLVEPNEELCKKCHNPKSPNYKSFNFKESLKLIDHSYSKK